MADAVIPIMALLIGALVVAYALFIRWRIRVHRARRELSASPPPSVPTLATILADQARADRPPVAAPDPVEEPSPPVRPASDPTGAPATSMVEAVAGISLPDTLSPLIEAAGRPCTERAAFTSTTTDPVLLRNSVGERFGAIGYELRWDGLVGSARRGATEIRIEVYPHASAALIGDQPLFPSAPPNLSAVDIWLP